MRCAYYVAELQWVQQRKAPMEREELVAIVEKNEQKEEPFEALEGMAVYKIWREIYSIMKQELVQAETLRETQFTA